MTENEQQHFGDLSNVVRQVPAKSAVEMNSNYKKHLTVADVNSKSEIAIADRFAMDIARSVFVSKMFEIYNFN